MEPHPDRGGGIASLLIAATFAEVSSRFDATGGPYLYTRAALGRFAAFEVGWMQWFGGRDRAGDPGRRDADAVEGRRVHARGGRRAVRHRCRALEKAKAIMKFAILGSGAVGGYYGARLARAGHDVTFIARGAHLAAIRERGLEIRSPALGDFIAKGRAEENTSRVGPVDLVLFAVKTYDNPTALPLIRPMLGE